MVLAGSDFHLDLTLRTRPVPQVYNLVLSQLEAEDVAFNNIDKPDAKKKLKMDPDTVCLNTIGTADKFVPNHQYNFFRTAKKILQRFHNVEIFVIGIHLDKKYDLDTSRIHFLGHVNDPRDYYKAADICLDALPQPSLGGTSYATLVGLAAPLFKYGASNIFNGKNFNTAELYERYIGTMNNEKEFLDKLEFLIANPDIRLQIAEEIRKEYVTMYCKDKITGNLEQLFRLSGEMQHLPRRIPDGSFFRDPDSAEIADTGFLQSLPDVFTCFRKYLTFRDRMTILAGLSAKSTHCLDASKLLVKWAMIRTMGRRALKTRSVQF
jgi:hypothetical protein